MVNPKLLTVYVQSRMSQFRYTRGKKQTPAPVFLTTEFFLRVTGADGSLYIKTYHIKI